MKRKKCDRPVTVTHNRDQDIAPRRVNGIGKNRREEGRAILGGSPSDLFPGPTVILVQIIPREHIDSIRHDFKTRASVAPAGVGRGTGFDQGTHEVRGRMGLFACDSSYLRGQEQE
jgi:hypothetical protein